MEMSLQAIEKNSAKRIKSYADCCCHEDSRKPCFALPEVRKERYTCVKKSREQFASGVAVDPGS